MRFLIGLLVISLAAVAYAQIPTPCYSPRLFEARMIEDDFNKNFTMRAKLSYDGDNQRIRIVEEVNIKDKRDFYDTLFIDNRDFQVEYALNLRTKKCEKRPLTRRFRPVQIPSNATFYGELYLGDSLLTQSWGGKTPQGGLYHLLWTVHDCLPVTETYYSTRTSFVHTTFFDVTLGISDPNVFIPPRECL
ncbi:mammalian ependymin-related protein 1-like [Lineus longissimus]|uniref:mammalian ependymin-related protein 1-like n=1 Tax=Lineus longissimus TaxID=88925 RepID=UPI002B4E62E4